MLEAENLLARQSSKKLDITTSIRSQHKNRAFIKIYLWRINTTRPISEEVARGPQIINGTQSLAIVPILNPFKSRRDSLVREEVQAL